MFITSRGERGGGDDGEDDKMKIKVWCDNGANIHSKRSTVIDIMKVFGFDNDEWAALTDDERDDILRDIAMEWFEWGYNEVQ